MSNNFNSEAANKAKKFIACCLGVNPDKVVPKATFDDLGADSIDIINLIEGIASYFDIEIPEEEYEKWSTAGDVIAFFEHFE